MVVCNHCLMAIESHEGRQWKKEIEYNDERISDDDEIFCEWCEEFVCSSDAVEI